MENKITDTWDNCYPSNWKGMIVNDAYAHPAKFSSKLIRRIYDHILSEGWVEPGMMIVDPFGGVALGALDAMRLGLRWRGIELEERFVKWGNENIQFWNNKFGTMPKWCGDAVLLQDDSRFLAQVLCGANGAVSSPYGDGSQHTGGNDLHPERMDGGEFFGVGLNGVVSSPPYGASINSESSGIDWEKAGRPDRLTTDAIGIQGANGREEKYGTQSAQLGAMKATDKGFQASVSSPPFQHTTGGTNVTSVEGPLADKRLLDGHAAGNMNVGYGDTDGNMGSAAPDDFWICARQVVEQVYQVLVSGAHAVFVVKNYVKGGREVQFCAQWQQMCEAVGFVTLHEHRAMLVRHKGLSTTTMDGETVSHEVSSKSFFRRIAEKKGSPPIDYEVVLCMVKPPL